MEAESSPLSVTVTVTTTDSSVSWSRLSPSFSLSMPSATSKRSSLTEYVCVSASSTSEAVTAPTTAPAAFSSTEPSAASIVGASFRSLTAMSTMVAPDVLPAGSEAVSVRVTESSVSWSRLVPSFSLSTRPLVISKRSSSTE